MSVMKRLEEPSGLMGRMMRTVGADRGVPNEPAGAVVLRGAARKCMGCQQKAACAQWLETHEQGAKRAPDYCPNADLFAQWSDDTKR